MRNRSYNDFLYRDFYSTVHKRKWKRGRSDEIEKFRKELGNDDFFLTIQSFKNPVKTDNENHIVSVYFDFDFGEGDVIEEAIDKSRQDALKVIEFFTKMDVREEHISIFFSGRKGFHVSIEPELFGLPPSNHMTYSIKQAATYLMELLGLGTMDDKVYTSPRMWRASNSVHSKSKLYCVELYLRELAELPASGIVEIAKEPRKPLWEDIEYEEIKVNQECNNFLSVFESEYVKLKTLSDVRPLKNIVKSSEEPVCMKDLLNNSIKKPHSGNQALMVIASYLKDNEVPLEDAIKVMVEWSKKIPKGMVSFGGERKIIASAVSVAKSVYADEKYHFACSFIRALGTQESSIACDYASCKVANEDDQQVAVPPLIELEDSVNPEYMGRKIEIRAMVSGKAYKPYMVPSKIIVTCNNEKAKSCVYCPMAAFGGKREFEISKRNEVLLSLIKVEKERYMSFVKRYFGIPEKCRFYKIETPSHYSIYDINLVPMIRFTPEEVTKDKTYVERTACTVGIDIESSKEYKVFSYLTKDPRDQSAILQLVEAIPIEGMASNFKMSKELEEKLRIFQLAKGQDEWGKMEEIHEDLSYNIVKIYNRMDMMAVIDLCYHSVTAFYFDGNFIDKGWVEALIIGDSGQGKTQTAKKLLNHYGLGTIVQGEGSKRTGLLYTFQQAGKNWTLKWGVIPLNDKGLVFMDEFSGVQKEDRDNMTNMRSSGFVEAHGPVDGKTYARTRLIFMTNPGDGKGISHYNYGVDAVFSIFKKMEDIRRLDICDIVASGEIAPEYLTKKVRHDVEHKYTSSLCNSLILWAWSREPEDVEFTEEATDEVFETTKFLMDRYTAEIPLCEPSDLRNKVARMSVATAARQFSTTTGKNIVVRKGHVLYVRHLVDMIYSKKSFGYADKSEAIMSVQESAYRRKNDVYEYFKGRFVEPRQLRSICLRFLELRHFNKTLAEDACGLDRDAFKLFWSFLMINGMIVSGGRLLEKSKDFIDVLRRIIKEDKEGG